MSHKNYRDEELIKNYEKDVCVYCDEKKDLLQRGFELVPWWFKDGYVITKDDMPANEHNYGVFIDRGYLRLADLDDCNCVESGEKIKINYCPYCGRPIEIQGEKYYGHSKYNQENESTNNYDG